MTAAQGVGLRPLAEAVDAAEQVIGDYIVAIAPAHQGRGVGRALLSRTLGPAWEAGIRTVDLTVTEENRPAVALYERLGFPSSGG